MRDDLKLPIRYGAIGGLFTIILSLLTYMFYRQLFSTFWLQAGLGLFSFAIAIFIPVWGAVTYKRDNGGSLTFREAFKCAFIISAIMMVCSNFMTFLIPNVIDPDYPGQLHQIVQNTTREAMEKWNVPEDDIDKRVNDITLEQFQSTPLQSLRNLGISLAVGMIFCAIIAAFVSRKGAPKPNLDETPPAT